MSTQNRPITIVDAAPSNTTRANKIVIETAKTGKLSVAVAVMSIFGKKKCKSQSANPGEKKFSCQKVESANFLEENSHKPGKLPQKMRKGQISKKLAYKLKKLELNRTNLKLKGKIHA